MRWWPVALALACSGPPIRVAPLDASGPDTSADVSGPPWAEGWPDARPDLPGEPMADLGAPADVWRNDSILSPDALPATDPSVDGPVLAPDAPIPTPDLVGSPADVASPLRDGPPEGPILPVDAAAPDAPTPDVPPVDAPQATADVAIHSEPASLDFGLVDAPIIPDPIPDALPDSAIVDASPDAPPLVGERFVIAGDICGSNCWRTALLLDNLFPAGASGVLATAGDNAYQDGTQQEFADKYDPEWGRHRSRTCPSPGNHDWNSGLDGYAWYFNDGTACPASGGNVGTLPDAAWYAYDVGTWRVYSMDSETCWGCGAGSPLYDWLAADLAANPRACALAYWHRPRWSTGEHGDDDSMSEVWTLLYDQGADVVVSGHDHDYERFLPQDDVGAFEANGMVEFVVGTGGASLRPMACNDPESVACNDTAWGVLSLTLAPGAYSFEFIPVAGQTFTDSGSSACR